MQEGKILYCGTDDSLIELLLGVAAMKMIRADTAEAVQTLVRQEQPHAVVLDFDSPPSPPLPLLKTILAEAGQAHVIGVMRQGPLRLAMSALRAGCHDFIHLREEPGRLQNELARLAERRREQQQAENLHARQQESHDFSRIIGNSAAMGEVLDLLHRIIQRKWVTVLLRGETGTGKELIARTIHYNSSTPSQPFVEINCSAIPENLLEAELFGYEKGAFTDAKTRKRGLFELAENGTLFLDEIGEISPQVQVKLLKAVEEKKIRRLGGTEDIQVNTRIIAATNRDLQAAIRDGQFRQDLYYRLNVITVSLPPLRERGDDVLILARHFLAHYAREYDSLLSDFTSEAEALLREYPWPGNIRELQHTIERIVLLGEGRFVTRTALERAIESETPMLTSKSAETTVVKIEIPPDGIHFDEIEKQVLQAVLEKMGWNRRRTSRLFKISRPRLARKIQKYRLQPPHPESENQE
ncbi:MAG: sigma-54 dependent transcriptional regulator [candidate division KSB1 bacterium]|nr:sigma-54 dependent transcriptional regulator [candidate division KSB1 bacterium]MDZ7274527.1 sigma-54 dependent transcriptional regulator [candidate division KSB1 bacterium]MDZ7284812.1 sigma-54 dependent transcriptional regulator [candidate division KSB1 bacterium]MDZ7297768.1 sigma-54 dependent transcriptional regulator [candidate division KSB1 bacterium]MDZ7306443.1 sigma-54 dependent transcriptional regulator [candidate division KSB1 bacterium]